MHTPQAVTLKWLSIEVQNTTLLRACIPCVASPVLLKLHRNATRNHKRLPHLLNQKSMEFRCLV